jgi:hypothetical protein
MLSAILHAILVVDTVVILIHPYSPKSKSEVCKYAFVGAVTTETI